MKHERQVTQAYYTCDTCEENRMNGIRQCLGCGCDVCSLCAYRPSVSPFDPNGVDDFFCCPKCREPLRKAEEDIKASHNKHLQFVEYMREWWSEYCNGNSDEEAESNTTN